MKRAKFFLFAVVILFVLYFIISILYSEYEYQCGCPDKPGGYNWAHPCYDGGE